MARQAVRDCGYEVALGLMPRSIGPLTFVFTGSGNVSQGAQEVCQDLPVEYVTPENLRKVAEHGSMFLNHLALSISILLLYIISVSNSLGQSRVYACEVKRPHHLERRDGGGYDREEYNEFPERYISTFSKKIAPFASVIVNGIYWATNSPKLLTIPDAKSLLRPANTPWLPYSLGGELIMNE